MRSALLLFILFFSRLTSAQSISQSLNSNWEFSEATKNEWKPATVPGTIHTDLLANKLIPDPYLDTNEKAVQWVETKTWEYKTTFDCDKYVWKQKNKELDFEGLDTYADVYLNDSLLFTADDMFLSYTKDVSKLLKKKKNVLRVVFHPIDELIAKNKALCDVKDLPGGDRVYVRKAQYQFGWDWGPRLVTCGIWKNVRLLGYTNTFIRDAQFQTVWISGDSAYVKYSVTLGGSAKTAFNLQITADSELVSDERLELDPLAKQPVIEGHFVIHHPKLWWCNGLGEPYLYRINISLSTKKIRQAKDFSFGVRTIELQRSDPATGKSDFRFILNDVDVFAKGANWIPCDNFVPRITHQKYSDLLNEAKNENMNMLRVWGGGIYEQDEFYDLCDSLGIMVWQDFMFACGMYPGSLAFYNQVKNEAYDNLLRLANHPCISVWCGNNEDYEGWINWDWQKDRKDAEIRQIETDYSAVFNNANGILVSAVNEVYSKWFPYLATSPQIGWGHPESLTQGDSHYWGVWWGEEPFSAYDSHVGRFMTEYGFQSVPAYSSITTFCSSRSPYDHTLLDGHQKDVRGNIRLDHYASSLLPSRTGYTVSQYSYLTQVMQRDAMTRAIEAHRRNEPYCMGTLYWQFNDCWPAISWSATDYYGQKKLAQYAIKDLYAPFLVSITERNDSILVYAVNDDTIEHHATLGYGWNMLDSANPFIASPAQVFVILSAHQSTLIASFLKKDVLKDHKAGDIFLTATLDVEGNYRPFSRFYFVPDKELNLNKNPGLNVTVNKEKNPDGSFTVTVYTSSLAKNVCLMLDDVNATFSDNGFDLPPNGTVWINVHSKYDADELRKKLQVLTINALK